MESMTLRCPVTIKAKVTEDLKAQLAAEIQDAIKKADMELQQIEFHAKRLMSEQAKIDAQGLTQLRQQIDAEQQKRQDLKMQLSAKLKATNELEIGAEIVRGNLERMVTVSIGDNLQKLMGAEILLEDDKVIAFRS